ncbi:hypothetical protein TpMuguga_02g02480 [Theileria parva strain Muguga]|uniref:uncharacterized protein n=1 Tax=Theileria parva strain Muguga TaxID=333668 RepID=UPI001C6238D7|nr:uncharacterized protein TpMuguga_02g02480 [Theileria parva strain Muguga]KAF5153643.1 hypothetical protein TpMuguga_02g02480 [Theileria parva strain Muguga]
MEENKKHKISGPNSPKSHDKKSHSRSNSNSIQFTVISNKNYSISNHRKKRSRHESGIKVTCINCQSVSIYQIGDYVKCSKCNSSKFSS